MYEHQNQKILQFQTSQLQYSEFEGDSKLRFSDGGLITFFLFLFSPIHPCDGLKPVEENSICQQVMDSAAKGELKKMKSFVKSKQHKINDDSGRTPLMIAAVFGQVEVAELLIKNGADIDATDKKGFTPLMYAAGFRYVHKKYDLFTGMKESQAMFTLKGRVAVFRVLFDRLADVDAKSSDGDTVFSIVKKEGVDDFDTILAEVNFDDPQKDMFSNLIESSEPMRIPNYFNPWEDVWDETPEKVDSGSLIISDRSLETGVTRYRICEAEGDKGRKIKKLNIVVELPFIKASISFEYSINFSADASLLIFEYYNDEGEVKVGLVEADPETKSVNIYALDPNPKKRDGFISKYLYRLSKNYDSKKSEFKMKWSDDGWVFMLKNPEGVEGKCFSGDDLDRLWKVKK